MDLTVCKKTWLQNELEIIQNLVIFTEIKLKYHFEGNLAYLAFKVGEKHKLHFNNTFRDRYGVYPSHILYSLEKTNAKYCYLSSAHFINFFNHLFLYQKKYCDLILSIRQLDEILIHLKNDYYFNESQFTHVKANLTSGKRVFTLTDYKYGAQYNQNTYKILAYSIHKGGRDKIFTPKSYKYLSEAMRCSGFNSFINWGKYFSFYRGINCFEFFEFYSQIRENKPIKGYELSSSKYSIKLLKLHDTGGQFEKYNDIISTFISKNLFLTVLDFIGADVDKVNLENRNLTNEIIDDTAEQIKESSPNSDFLTSLLKIIPEHRLILKVSLNNFYLEKFHLTTLIELIEKMGIIFRFDNITVDPSNNELLSSLLGDPVEIVEE